jgi:hypothetical protein
MSVHEDFFFLEMKTPSSTKVLRELLEIPKCLGTTASLLVVNKDQQLDPG